MHVCMWSCVRKCVFSVCEEAPIGCNCTIIVKGWKMIQNGVQQLSFKLLIIIKPEFRFTTEVVTRSSISITRVIAIRSALFVAFTLTRILSAIFIFTIVTTTFPSLLVRSRGRVSAVSSSPWAEWDVAQSPFWSSRVCAPAPGACARVCARAVGRQHEPPEQPSPVSATQDRAKSRTRDRDRQSETDTQRWAVHQTKASTERDSECVCVSVCMCVSVRVCECECVCVCVSVCVCVLKQ